MKVLKWVLLTLAVLFVIIIVWAAFLPKQVVIEAQIDIDRPHQIVFHHAASFTDRVKWDPWLEMEPTAKSQFKFKEGYVGSYYTWEGEMLGNGKMQVDSVRFAKYIASSLFFGDSKEPNLIQWFITPNDKSSYVRWSFSGEASFPFERVLYKLFIRSSLEQSLNKGLANFKKYLENKPATISRLLDIDVMKIKPTEAMSISYDTNLNEIAEKMKGGFMELFAEVAKQKLEINGNPFSRYTDYNADTGDISVEIAVPVKKLGKKRGHIEPKKFDGRLIFKGVHMGPYNEMEESYKTLMESANDKRLILSNVSWEFYLNSKEKVKEITDLKTILGFEIEK